jgi:hypothetical protein
MFKIILSAAFIAVIALLFLSVVAVVIGIAVAGYIITAIISMIYKVIFKPTELSDWVVTKDNRIVLKNTMLTREEYYNSKA